MAAKLWMTSYPEAMLVFVPLPEASLRRWAEGSPLGVTRAYAATPQFLAAFGLSAADQEDAERTLLEVAALDALQRFGRRLVAVADGVARDLADEFGAVEVGSLPFAGATALFADHPDAAAALGDLAGVLGGAGLAEAWDHPAHARLMETTDLLWYGPEEWARLVP